MGFDLIIISTNGEKIDYDGYWSYNYSKLSDFFYIKKCFGLSVGKVIAIINHRINLLEKNKIPVAPETVDDFGMIGKESIWEEKSDTCYSLLLRSLHGLSDKLCTLPYDGTFTEIGWELDPDENIVPYDISLELEKTWM